MRGREALFLGELLELGDHGVDRAVVAGRLRVDERDEVARGLRFERRQRCRQAERGRRAALEDIASRRVVQCTFRQIE